jgi:hypothetical protein
MMVGLYLWNISSMIVFIFPAVVLGSVLLVELEVEMDVVMDYLVTHLSFPEKMMMAILVNREYGSICRQY